ncbi:CDP-alcohol phosphatidyltransferase family protein [Boudabousia marimammalium]|uniref:Phosphatidylcholine synthase n=1 Tax=Boudabousia marimammalium TaxID=156892 RepID=A0A1Q5PRG0_9ACTO|nr:phosphatidylcholine synthase [Boudabousia marimammalium]OKL50136.1 phosphatidylcholine synthase [Boudabousia marimammalium]
MSESKQKQFTTAQYIKAWGVHAFTMTGVLWAILALTSLIEGRIGWMWIWLSVALIVDAVDGTMARKARVSEVVPWFDGVILDDIVDYLTWTFIPALFMMRYIPFGSRNLAVVMTVFIAASSMFCYANKGMKAKDYYFVGFPAAWNIVAAYFWILGTPAWFNVVASLLIGALTLSRLTFVHPLRVRAMMPINIVVTVVWIVMTGLLLGWHPVHPTWVLVLWWISGIYFIGIGILRTAIGRVRMARLASLEEE